MNTPSSDFASGKSAHAYILDGPAGSGKRTAATLIAQAVLCENRNDPSHPLPCGKCPACRKIAGGLSVDVLRISNGDHATIGVVITTDGSISDIPREDYLEAEERVIRELQEIGKPFIVLLNSLHPASERTVAMAKDIAISLTNLKTDYIDLYQVHNPNVEQLKAVAAPGGALEAASWR